MGRCAECGAWGSFVEEAARPAPSPGVPSAAGAGPVPLEEVAARDVVRRSTGIRDLDRVLGGGLVPGSVVLVGGEPGIGKSTLLLQAACRLAERDGAVLYVSAEESARQVRMRAERLGLSARGVLLHAETVLERILEAAVAASPTALVVDSIQTVAAEGAAAGTVGQVRECASRLASFAKRTETPLFLIGHVTKDGSLAGPKTLEHLVDAVLSFEGERFHAHRVLRALKNRFGPVHELGLFEMSGRGLEEVTNPSALTVGAGAGSRPGSAVLAAVEGTRPLLIEVQALTVAVKYGTPRRTAIGFDPTRLALLLAVLERHGGLALSGHDVFLNFAGGAGSEEPAADLAVAAAVAGSFLGKPFGERRAVFGEVGLLGEVRPVPDAGRRLRELSAMGFTGVVLPAGNASEAAEYPDLQVTPVASVGELLARYER